METASKIPVIRVSEQGAFEFDDLVAGEMALTLFVNGVYIVSLLCSPYELEAMAVGFLLSEGLLDDRKNLQSVTVDLEAARVEVQLDNLPDNWQ